MSAHDPLDCPIEMRGACDVTSADLDPAEQLVLTKMQLRSNAASANGDIATAKQIRAEYVRRRDAGLAALRAERTRTTPTTDRKGTTMSCNCGKPTPTTTKTDARGAREAMIRDQSSQWQRTTIDEVDDEVAPTGKPAVVTGAISEAAARARMHETLRNNWRTEGDAS